MTIQIVFTLVRFVLTLHPSIDSSAKFQKCSTHSILDVTITRSFVTYYSHDPCMGNVVFCKDKEKVAFTMMQ